MNTRSSALFGATVVLLLYSLNTIKPFAAAEEAMPVEKAIAALESRNEEVRRRAIYEIRDEILLLPAERTAPLVLLVAKFLNDPDGTVRRGAADTLASVGGSAAPARDQLVEAARNYPSDDVAVFAINALTNIGARSPQWGGFLLGYLEGASTVPQRVAALEAISTHVGLLEHSEVQKRVRPFLDEGTDPVVRGRAVSCLAAFDIADPALWEALQKMASGRGVLSQHDVLKFLSRYAPQVDKGHAKSLLAALLNSSDPFIRKEAEKIQISLKENGRQ